MSVSWRKDNPTSSNRGYNSAWVKYRLGYLLKHPDCARCGGGSVVVDHIKPHRGSQELFWDKSNHQPLCKFCHDSYKQRLEKSGRIKGCDVFGRPIDPSHHWNKE